MSGPIHFPYVPLNKLEGFKLDKGIEFKDSAGRSAGDFLRRYPNGILDVNYAAGKVIDALEALKDVNQGGSSHIPLTTPEISLLTNIFPELDFNLPKGIADVTVKLSAEERKAVHDKVIGHIKEIANWNAGYGGGSVEGRDMTISKSMEKLEQIIADGYGKR